MLNQPAVKGEILPVLGNSRLMSRCLWRQVRVNRRFGARRATPPAPPAEPADGRSVSPAVWDLAPAISLCRTYIYGERHAGQIIRRLCSPILQGIAPASALRWSPFKVQFARDLPR